MDIGAFFTFCFLPLFIFFIFGYVFGAVALALTPTPSTYDSGDNSFFYTSMWMDD